jgi:hypothetical protein
MWVSSVPAIDRLFSKRVRVGRVVKLEAIVKVGRGILVARTPGGGWWTNYEHCYNVAVFPTMDGPHAEILRGLMLLGVVSKPDWEAHIEKAKELSARSQIRGDVAQITRLADRYPELAVRGVDRLLKRAGINIPPIRKPKGK